MPVPVPVPAPAPVPIPAPPALPPVVEVPTAPQIAPLTASAPSVGSVVERAGSPAVAALSSPPASEEGEEGSRRRSREGARRGLHGTRYRKRGRLVRGLRGCLDRLVPMRRNALILRYGIGRVAVRSPRRAARELGVSRERFRRLERRGVRSLAREARTSSCERTRVRDATLAVVYSLLSPEAPRTEFASADAAVPALRLASASPDAGEGGVAGARESGGEEPAGGEDGSAGAGPFLPTPFGDLRATPDSPLFLLLVAVSLVAAGFAARVIARAVR